MQVRDGPAAVRGEALPPRRHWPRGSGRRRRGVPRVRRPAASVTYPPPRGQGGRRWTGVTTTRPSGRVTRCRARSRIERSVRHVCRFGHGFPGEHHRGERKVTVAKRPTRIVSISPTATESLFAIGAGKQVVAVDDQSDYPKGAPKTALGIHAQRRGDRRVPARPRDRLVRPEGSRRRAHEARIPVILEPASTIRARTSRSGSSGR